MRLIEDDKLFAELKLLEKYLSAPVVYPDAQSGYFCVKSGGTKQDVYKRFFNARYMLKGLLNSLEDEDNNGQQ